VSVKAGAGAGRRASEEGKTPRMDRRAARGMRMTEARPDSPAPPRRLLRHPSAVLFLLMREAYRLGQQRAQRAGASLAEAMRFPHFAVLACLDEFGPASQKEISERVRTDPSDLVTFVDFLERAGFVARKRDERDRRRYALELTAAGRRALRRRDGEAVRLNEELLAPLRPEEREQLRRLLLRALAHHDPRVPVPGPDEGPA
jgi:MarR family transcriptional regulator, lower aerobic nicotinate degradation pathway regulator